ncbi:hypothetical protein B0H14DRAFT_3527309 [Mycena olivaceomarginata]|nr:hypothetical protein B0H14DRAFT_3527309 [Mycena olivaceomarginata]
MFSRKFLLSTVTVALLAGSATAFTGTAQLGLDTGVTSCNCPAFNGPFAIAVPRDLVTTQTCCNYQVNLSVNGQTTTAVFSGYYDAGAGTQNIALSASAFAALDSNADDTSIAGVTWSFFESPGRK